MTHQKRRFIKDLIYNYITLTPLEAAIIETPIFKRLRNISQNSLAVYTYPSLRGSRFEHSLGTMHLAGMMINAALSSDSEVQNFVKECREEFHTVLDVKLSFRETKDLIIQAVRIAALLHDLGHLPFSHQSELPFKNCPPLLRWLLQEDHKEFSEGRGTFDQLHEFATLKLIETNPDLDKAFSEAGQPDLKQLVLAILKAPKSPSPLYTLKELISGDLDADRGDAILRDGALIGSEMGKYDLLRIVDNLVVVRQYYNTTKSRYVIRPTKSALSAVEAFLAERYRLRKWVYYHHFVKFADTALSYVIYKLLFLAYDYTRNNLKKKSERIISFAKKVHEWLPIERWHYQGYLLDGIPSDDIWLINALRNIWQVLDQDRYLKRQYRDIYKLLNIVLFRDKAHIALWKEPLDYHDFHEWLEKRKYIGLDGKFVKILNDEINRKRLPRNNKVVLQAIDIVTRTREYQDYPILNLLAGNFIDPGIDPSLRIVKEYIEPKLKRKNISALFMICTLTLTPYMQDPLQSRKSNVLIVYPSRGGEYKGKVKCYEAEEFESIKRLKDMWERDIQLFVYIIPLGERQLKTYQHKQIFADALSDWFAQEVAPFPQMLKEKSNS